jgi:hypothetical protein
VVLVVVLAAGEEVEAEEEKKKDADVDAIGDRQAEEEDGSDGSRRPGLTVAKLLMRLAMGTGLDGEENKRGDERSEKDMKVAMSTLNLCHLFLSVSTVLRSLSHRP